MAHCLLHPTVVDEAAEPLTHISRLRLREAVLEGWRKLPPPASAKDLERWLQTYHYQIYNNYVETLRGEESRFRYYRKIRAELRPEASKERAQAGGGRSALQAPQTVQLVPGDETTRVPFEIWFEKEDDRDLFMWLAELALKRYSKGSREGRYQRVDLFMEGGAIRFLPPRVPTAAFTVQIRMDSVLGSTIETTDVVRPDLRPPSKKSVSH